MITENSTSNPTTFYHAIKDSHDLRRRLIHQNSKKGKSGEALFFE